jgi:hypothetical protein
MSDIIDTRDLEKELNDLLEACECSTCGGTGEKPGTDDDCETCGGTGHAETADDMPDDDPDKSRAVSIEEAREEIAEWHSGETLIADDESFTEYAQQLAEDLGVISSDAQWPLYCIDWERAARDLRADYSLIEIDGTDYLYRSN